MTTQPPPSGLQRYPISGNSSATAFALTAGLVGLTGFVPPNEVFGLQGAQGVQIMFGATESTGDNDAFDYRIWIVHKVLDVEGATVGYDLECFGYGTATLGAGAFIGGVAAGATGRIADTLTFTATSVGGSPEGPGAVIQTAYGVTGAAYSPASDLAAKLYLPHLGWAEGIIIEFDSTTGDPLGIFALIARV